VDEVEGGGAGGTNRACAAGVVAMCNAYYAGQGRNQDRLEQAMSVVRTNGATVSWPLNSAADMHGAVGGGGGPGAGGAQWWRGRGDVGREARGREWRVET
jgi:hypothetical protein